MMLLATAERRQRMTPRYPLSCVLMLATAIIVMPAAAIASPYSTTQRLDVLGDSTALTPQAAYERLRTTAATMLFVDVRSRAEVNVLGASRLIDANIPFLKLSEPLAWDWALEDLKMESNFDFIPALTERLTAKQLDRHSAILLIDRDGERAAQAAKVLAAAGFTRVAYVRGGYHGEPTGSGFMSDKRRSGGWLHAELP